jgi:aspartate/methionine/tyrosine aminotransferase
MKIATLVSLTATPLCLKEIHDIDFKRERARVSGQAVLFERSLYAIMPEDISLGAALAAFDPTTQAELQRRKSEFADRRDFLYQALLRLGFDIPVKPDGAFYIYANCASFTDDSYQFALALLEAEGVSVTPGIDFGSHKAREHIRFAYTTSINRMAEAINRLECFIRRR